MYEDYFSQLDSGIADTIVSQLNKDQALTLLWALKAKFDWAGCTPVLVEDVEEALERPLTPEEREQVLCSWEFRKGIAEVQATEGNEMIWNMIRDLDLKGADELDEEVTA